MKGKRAQKKNWRRWHHGPDTTTSQTRGGGGCCIQGPGPAAPREARLRDNKSPKIGPPHKPLHRSSFGAPFGALGVLYVTDMVGKISKQCS